MKIFLLALLVSTVSLAQTGDGITVVSAKWGTKDVTREAASFCDSKTNCAYLISKRFIGRQGGRVQSFSMTWICDGREDTKSTKTIDKSAEDQTISLDCSTVSPEVLEVISVDPVPDSTPVIEGEINPQTVNYYRNLLVQFKKNPSSVKLEHFNQTFYPVEDAAPESSENLLNCTLKLGRGNCTPDTFYSWGPEEKLQNIFNATNNKKWSPLNKKTVFMNQSSVGSYCYGKYPVRLKFSHEPKKGPLNAGSFAHTWNEWIVDNGSDVESISYARPEHIDEVITETILRIKSTSRWSEAALYFDFGQIGRSAIFMSCVPEVLVRSEYNLVNNIMMLIEAYLDGKSWIHVNGCEKVCDESQHFKTNWPTFFNPN